MRRCAGDGSAAAVAQPSAQTEEQRLKVAKHAEKALRKQRWEAQQAAVAHQDETAAAAGPASDADGADVEDADDAGGAAEPEVARRKKSHKAASTSDVVRVLRLF